MIKLVLWDYTSQSSTWCENFLRPNVAQIVRTLKPDDPDQAEFIMRGDWDYVFIFDDDNSQAVFNEILSTMRAMNVPTDNIIFATTALSWTDHPAAAYLLLNPTEEPAEKVFRWLNFVNHKKWHQYNVCTVEGLNYVATSADEYTLALMCLDRKNYAADEMKAFHALTKKFYGVDDDDGYFLDLGANIGTTGVYFLQKLAPRLKLFAVEPDAENFKLLRVNLIMNDLDNRATLVNCGLGDKFDTLSMYRDPTNPACNGFLCEGDRPTETIQIAPLDYLLAESDISPAEVKYIWIDTEGFEAQVLLGAKNLLAQTSAPLFVECNLGAWKNSGLLERLIEFLATVGYRHFITIQEFLRTGNEKIYPIKDILVGVNYVEPPLGQVGDIFLIKNLQA